MIRGVVLLDSCERDFLRKAMTIQCALMKNPKKYSSIFASKPLITLWIEKACEADASSNSSIVVLRHSVCGYANGQLFASSNCRRGCFTLDHVIANISSYSRPFSSCIDVETGSDLYLTWRLYMSHKCFITSQSAAFPDRSFAYLGCISWRKNASSVV